MPNSKGWYDAYCPLHEDTKRSAGFNFELDLWSCRANCGSGSLRELVARLEAEEAAMADAEPVTFDPFEGWDKDALAKSSAGPRRRQDRPAPTNEQIEEWHERLMLDDELVMSFKDRRGIEDVTLDEFEIGWSDEDRAYTVPIRDADGNLLNIRLYRIDHQQGTTKIWSWGGKGMDASAIYPERVLKENDRIIIAEGEWDALMLNQYGFPAVTGTTGAKQWQTKWNRKFTGKDVIVCYDRDKAGDDGAEKVVTELTGIAHSVSVLELPLEWRERGGLDVTDYLYKLGNTAADFAALLKTVEPMVGAEDGTATTVSVRESFNHEHAGKPMELIVTVTGKTSEKHLFPHKVTFLCGMNADKLCHGCPMNDADGRIDTKLPLSSAVMLKFRDVNDKARDEALREHIGAHRCGRMDTNVKQYLSTETLLVRTSIDQFDETESDIDSRAVLNIGQYATETNRIIKLTGTTHPDPKTQRSIFQAWETEQVESSLDTYVMTEEDVELMRTFQPKRKQTPLQKAGEIARDLIDNVTHIYNRPDLHVAMDLVWHSVISFPFAGETINKGWLELLVVGDARTGKSEVATKLAEHYRYGRIVSCEAASLPGLLGAVKTMPGSKEWTLEWGAIPLNDRRLVALDEAGGLTTDQIGQLSSVRSSGRAEIHKAIQDETNARTRLIWLSNPRDNRMGMAAYMYGVRAIPPLIGNQEDVARFDFAMSVSSGDVATEVINSRKTRKRRHVHTSDACHALIKWVWSRKRDDVIWDRGAENLVFKESVRLGREYVADPPLIQGQNVRQKLARLAVALAARTFSTDETCTKVMVEKEHVEGAITFLEHIYGSNGFGYKEVSKRAKADEQAAIARLDEVKEYLYTRPGLARFLISSQGSFRRQQLEEMLNYTKEEANLVIQRLAAMHMIQSNSDWDYRLTPHLNTILRETKE